MTAELVIMNKEAIAIAADSASTIGSKIYTTNKVFMLSKFCPIGIMIFGNAEVMGVPWELIIKLFRDYIVTDQPYERLEDYAHTFIDFLDNNKHLFPKKQQIRWVEAIITHNFIKIKKDFEKRLDRNSSSENKNHTIDVCINKQLERLESEVSLLWKNRSRAHIKMVSGPHYKLIDEIRDETFKDISLDTNSKYKLERIAALSFYNNATGIVIAGFGQHDLFPVTVTYAIGGLINNQLVYEKSNENRITFNKPADIVPFAQSDVINTYLNGIEPEFDRYLQEDVIPTIIETHVDGFVKYILSDLKEEIGDEKLLKKLTKNYNELKEEVKPIINNLKSDMMKLKVKGNRKPIETAIAFLPKDELAIMAESLLTITSLKRKYSIFSLESVGGDIDVAVISKSDGFVWIKRKHYFDKELNHHFFRNYFNKPMKDYK